MVVWPISRFLLQIFFAITCLTVYHRGGAGERGRVPQA